jgi:phosphoglycolate phosphatase
VLFDLDGTLVHSPIDFAEMRTRVVAIVAEAGVDPRPFARLDILAMARAAASAVPDSAGLLASIDAALVRIELDAAELAAPAEGASELLEWLHAGGRGVGIVTRNSPEAVRRVLRRIPLPHDVLVTRQDTPRVKPDPLHLAIALERLGARAGEAVMIGDHRMDMQAARAAGIAAIGVLTPGQPNCFRPADADAVLANLGELRGWI